MTNDIFSLRFSFVFAIFFGLFFLLRFYDIFYLYTPVTVFGNPKAITLQSHILFNFIPYSVYTLIKILFNSALLYGVLVINSASTNTDTMFGTVFKIITISEYMYLLEIMTRIVFFTFVKPDYEFESYQNFNPLSIASIFSTNSLLVDNVLEELNGFLIMKVLIVIKGIEWATKFSFKQASLFVLQSYGIIFILWLVVKTYFFS